MEFCLLKKRRIFDANSRYKNMLRPREYEKFINPTDEEFQKQIRFKHEGKRRLNELKLPEERLHVGYEKEIDIAGDVSTIHGFDFIDGVIPEKKQELQQRGIKRKIRICDIGSGLGLFCDQLKHYHGLDTKIFGTSLRRKGDRGRKKSSTDALEKKLNIKITFVSKTKQELINLVKNVLKPSADGTIAYERICLGLLELLNPNHRQIDINERKKMSKIFSLMCGHQSVQFTKN